jgi:hypothetical protein
MNAFVHSTSDTDNRRSSLAGQLPATSGRDWTTELNLFCQHRWRKSPRFDACEVGVEGPRRFSASVIVGNGDQYSAFGSSMKNARVLAAEKALRHLGRYKDQITISGHTVEGHRVSDGQVIVRCWKDAPVESAEVRTQIFACKCADDLPFTVILDDLTPIVVRFTPLSHLISVSADNNTLHMEL